MNILLINPWIYDFAAYDLWLKPLGLLYISSILKNAGFEVTLLDCMDRFHAEIPESGKNISEKYGCGHFYHEEIPKPAVLRNIPKKFKRYGLNRGYFIRALDKVPKPSAILVSSGMTYWYPGVFEAIRMLKERFPGVPVILGGIYATLCRRHAEKYSNADHIIESGNLGRLFEIINAGAARLPENFSSYPAPDYSFYKNSEYFAYRTSAGCVFNCTYCAAGKLESKFHQKNPETVTNEIIALCGSLKVKNIAFYDDALLANADKHIKIVLEGLLKRNIQLSFHTPNGLHAKFLDDELAFLMRKSGFINPRISLETSDSSRQKTTGNKVDNEIIEKAFRHLARAGYASKEITVYIMLGMPGQELKEVNETVGFLMKLNARISLSEYSPIPHTADWKLSGLEDDSDPLLQNNSIYYLGRYQDNREVLELKNVITEYNHKN